MSTQSYYKDRLGFDPREALYDGAPPSSQSSTTIKSGSRSRSVQHHYTSSTTTSSSQQPANGNNNNNHYDYHNNSPSKKIKHSAAYTSNTMVSGVGASSGSAINISGSNINSQADGYEDALTQFKGTMSVWDYFVENWDITGMNNHTLRTPQPYANFSHTNTYTRIRVDCEFNFDRCSAEVQSNFVDVTYSLACGFGRLIILLDGLIFFNFWLFFLCFRF